jgi:hypothetical protein
MGTEEPKEYLCVQMKFERSIVSISLRSRIRRDFLLGCVSGAVLLILVVGQAAAAVYPGGGSTFSGGTEGWTVETKCSVPAPLCIAKGEYAATSGNPSGSLGDKSEIALGLLGLFTAEAVETSPAFTAAESGAGSLSLERQFENAELASLNPTVTYTANLVDKTSGSKQQAFTEAVEGATGFAPKQGPVALVAGHSYVIEIDAITKSSLLSVGLLGSTTFHLDNVSVTGPGGGGNGGGGGGGGGDGNNGGNGGEGANGANGGVSSARLESLIQSSSLVGPAILRGSKLSVKAKCPAKVGVTCTITLQGMLNRHKPATTARKAKVKKAKTKNFVLTVKPAARSKVKTKKKLLFKETVKAGKSKATVWKAIKLVRK